METLIPVAVAVVAAPHMPAAMADLALQLLDIAVHIPKQ
jgi:hypothetical protein